MAEGTTIDIKRLTVEELAGVVSIYPWFGAARVELCRRLGAEGPERDGGRMLAEAALYVPDRRRLSAMAASGRNREYPDADVEALLKSQLSSGAEAGGGLSGAKSSDAGRDIRIAGGDYFSREDYDGVKKDGDAELFRCVAAREKDSGDEARSVPAHLGFCTRTLAEIYAEQGYLDEAKSIYSQLILAYPEKSAYFASLIEKLG